MPKTKTDKDGSKMLQSVAKRLERDVEISKEALEKRDDLRPKDFKVILGKIGELSALMQAGLKGFGNGTG